jgi:hypothetical protein
MIGYTEAELNSILLKNRNILRRNYALKKYTIRLSELILQEFVFSCFTHHSVQDGDPVTFNYNFGITEFFPDCFRIIKAPNIMSDEKKDQPPREVLRVK